MLFAMVVLASSVTMMVGLRSLEPAGALTLATVELTPTVQTLPTGATARVTADVEDQDGNPIIGAAVTFSRSGANPANAQVVLTGTTGSASYAYAGSKPGRDSITATVADSPPAIATAAVVWTPASWRSDDCDAGNNVVSGFLGGAYVKLKTLAAGASTSVCAATEDGGAHLGGKVTITGTTPTAPVGVDQDPALVGSCAANPSNDHLQDGEVNGGQPWALDVTLFPSGTTNAAWVCVQLGPVGFRLRIATTIGSTGASFYPDSTSSHVPAYVEDPWPVLGQPSAACQAATTGTRTRVVNATVGLTPVALYTWQESSGRASVCVRAAATGRNGVRATVDAGSALATIRPGSDLSPCSYDLASGPETQETPSYAVKTSEPNNLPWPPVSACLSIAGFMTSMTIDAGSVFGTATFQVDEA